jgi:hypothetical protein
MSKSRRFKFFSAYFVIGDLPVSVNEVESCPVAQSDREEVLRDVTEDSVDLGVVAHSLAVRSNGDWTAGEILRQGALKIVDEVFSDDGSRFAPAYLMFRSTCFKGRGFCVSWIAD